MGSVLLRQGDGGALRLYNKVCCLASLINMLHGITCRVLVQLNRGPTYQAGWRLLSAALNRV
jgi:hypothetical protein